jgi:hypothetical protein
VKTELYFPSLVSIARLAEFFLFAFNNYCSRRSRLRPPDKHDFTLSLLPRLDST